MTRLIVNASCRVAVIVMLAAMGFPATGDQTAEEVDVLLAEAGSPDPLTGSPGQLCSGAGGEDGC